MTIGLIYGILFFVFGACIGSFLNVCIVRMPEEKSVITPRSHCPKCKKMIPMYLNIPIISYIMLRGKCRECGEKFSIRYLFVEVLTGLMFVGFYSYYGLDVLLIPYIFMTCCFIVATFVDFEYKIIPDEVSVGGMCVGLVMSFFIPDMHVFDIASKNFWIVRFQSLGLSVMGVLIGGGLIYAMGILGDLMFKKESMGGGDIKLLAMIGAFLGWQMAILTFFIAPVFGAVYGIVERIRTKDSAIAYGPFLVIGALICLFYGDRILAYILRGYGIY